MTSLIFASLVEQYLFTRPDLMETALSLIALEAPEEHREALMSLQDLIIVVFMWVKLDPSIKEANIHHLTSYLANVRPQ